MTDKISALCNTLAVDAWVARIRQRPDGEFELREPMGTPLEGRWFSYLPGGYPYGQMEVDLLKARGDRITEENVLVRYP